MDNKKRNELIGARLKERREQLGISQDDLGAKLGFKPHSGAISRYERGIVEIPTNKLQIILSVLRMDANSLFQDLKDEKNVDVDFAPQVPLYSWVQAGTWTDFGQQSSEVEYIDLPYGMPLNSFAVRVRGHSMTRLDNTSICNNSIVFCTPVDMINPSDLNGKIVIAQYRDTATIKEFFYDGEVAYLRPWNPNPVYKILEFNDEVRIVGIVRKVQIDL